MKVVILAGGLGTRMGDETLVRPKPLIEVGGHPLLWHIMNIYAAGGFDEFVIALGYRGDMIKDYFVGFQSRTSDLTVDLKAGTIVFREKRHPDWMVHLIDTGVATRTGGRVKRLKNLIGTDPFLLTYGDGLADINVQDLVSFHRSHGKLATVTAVRPPARFGALDLDVTDNRVLDFNEKPQADAGWINGGFFVMEPQVLDYIDGDETALEAEPLSRLARDNQLFAYRLEGFWQPMDTLRERQLLERLWERDAAPWRRPRNGA
jgi:glucose-1-phosphate cytidylyltransferase